MQPTSQAPSWGNARPPGTQLGSTSSSVRAVTGSAEAALTSEFSITDTSRMSYDLFAQAFRDGDSVSDPHKSEAILDALRPFVIDSANTAGFRHTRTTDGGEADFYV
jgi:hypothetical protein